jgi:chemotaxis protein methyltransferase CheR
MDLMTDKISSLMIERGVDSPIDYYYLLKYGEGEAAENEWPNLLNAISVRETFFWREFDQIRALVDVVMPLLSEQTRSAVRIWSAACATGEEPLTIAMALDQSGWLNRLPIEIHASDASTAALCAAQLGIYRERAFRNLCPELRRRYFTPVNNGWKIDAQLHSRIHWHRANLTVESDVSDLARAHVIFCRNVFIYFSHAAIRKTVKTISDRILEPGFLFLGAAESLFKFTTDFDLREIAGAFAYVKNMGGN